MAKSTAERQRAYRQRHLAEGDAERLNVVVSVQAKRQLERLARHRGVTQREILETMLAQAERRTTANLRNNAGYYSGTSELFQQIEPDKSRRPTKARADAPLAPPKGSPKSPASRPTK